MRIILTLLILGITSISCNSQNSHCDIEKIQIDKSNIVSIEISVFPKTFETLQIFDSANIFGVVKYFESLRLVEFFEDTKVIDGLVGGGYKITIQYADKNERILSHIGNQYIVDKNKCVWKIDYKDAIKFDGIAASIVEQRFEKTDMLSISGIVKSVKESPSSASISCVIQNSKQEIYNVDLGNSKIIDSTGNGWLIIHKDDEVRIFYDNETDSKQNIQANTVFIKKTNH
jgi:hypothetical protein